MNLKIVAIIPMLSSLPGGAAVLLAAAEALPFGVATADLEGIVTFANTAYARLSDCSPGELIGHPPAEFPWLTLATASPPSPWFSESVCTRRNGVVCTIRHTVSTLRNDAGQATGFWITQEEIAGWAPAQAFPTSRANRSAIYESITEGIVVQSSTGVIDACNQSAQRILGLTADQNCRLPLFSGSVVGSDSRGRLALSGETHPAMVVLQTGQPLSNVIMGVHKFGWSSNLDFDQFTSVIQRR